MAIFNDVNFVEHIDIGRVNRIKLHKVIHP